MDFQSHEEVLGSNADECTELFHADGTMAHTVALGDHGNKTTSEQTGQMSYLSDAQKKR